MRDASGHQYKVKMSDSEKKSEQENVRHLIFSIKRVTKTLFSWSGGPQFRGVGFFCFVSPRA